MLFIVLQEYCVLPALCYPLEGWFSFVNRKKRVLRFGCVEGRGGGWLLL